MDEPSPMTVACPGGEIVWTPVTEPGGHMDLLAGGFLFGPHALTMRVRSLLSRGGEVPVAHGVTVALSSGPATVADVAAAMLAAAGDRRTASDSLWDALDLDVDDEISADGE